MSTDPNPPAEGQVSRRLFMRHSVALGGAAGAASLTPMSGSGPLQASEETAGQAISGKDAPLFSTSGVVPRVGVSASLTGPRSESGIGALMPWADRLWFITYTSHTARTGSGTGLYWIDESMTVHKHPESAVGTYANRFVHDETEQMIIGPHIVDTDNKVRTIKDLVDIRLTATMTHLTDPKNKVYMLGMEAELFEVNVRTLRVKQLFNLNNELGLPAGSKPHYKGGFSTRDRIIVANNTYHERDYTEGQSTGGLLAEWEGKGAWRKLESTAFVDIAGVPMGDHANAIAIGWDRASVLMKVLNRGKWRRYRLPKASHCYDQAWYTEWPRIREVETERFLMDMHGMFYEVPRQAYGGHVWGIKPVCQHLRMVPDFCSWKGFLVLAGNQNTKVTGNNLVGEPQSNLWFGTTDDLWSFGKPQGWGGPWFDTVIAPNEPSDPYLMTGFDRKCLHVSHDSNEEVSFEIEVDFLGNGTWHTHQYVNTRAKGYGCYVFPEGFSAHWARVLADKACKATAQFVYT
jgi:hypothetical protein